MNPLLSFFVVRFLFLGRTDFLVLFSVGCVFFVCMVPADPSAAGASHLPAPLIRVDPRRVDPRRLQPPLEDVLCDEALADGQARVMPVGSRVLQKWALAFMALALAFAFGSASLWLCAAALSSDDFALALISFRPRSRR